MKLSDLKIGDSAIVDKVGGEGALRQHFLDMGLIPGSELTLVKFAPMGDPMQFRIHDYELTLRKEDAANIEVTLCNPATHPSPKSHRNTIAKPRVEHPGLGETGRFHCKKDEHALPITTPLCLGG